MKLLSKENAKAVPPSREIGSSSCCWNAIGTSAPKRGRTAFSSDWFAAYCHREKVGPLNILTMIWKWPFLKMLSHSIPTNWIFYRRSSALKNQWQNNVSFSVCVFLGAIICARSRTLDALAPEPIGIDKTKRELWQSGHDNFHASNCRDKYSFTTAPQKKCAGIMMTASAREIKTLFLFVQTLTTIRSV